MVGHCPPIVAFVGAEPKDETGTPPEEIIDGGAVPPKDDPNNEPSIPVDWKDNVPGGTEGPGKEAGTDNPESKDSTEFEAGVVVFTSVRESKFAQSLLPDVVSGTEDACTATCACWTVAVGGSGTASKSINEASTFVSVGFTSDDAKLLEDAVLC